MKSDGRFGRWTMRRAEAGSGRLLSGRGVGGGGGWGSGVWDPEVSGTEMAQSDFPCSKFRFFPRWSLWSGEGGRGFGGRP